MNLPLSYLENMKDLLLDEYQDYLNCFESDRYYGLRVNTNKISVKDFLKISPFELIPIPWTSDGFYYKQEDRPAKHPYYYAGLYYLQEPSAMLPGEVLPIEENDIVLDACAAPGGKSLKLANKLNNTGVLLSNDISVSRAQVLLKNIENFGIKNAYVLAEDITKLTDNYSNFFDKILLDAPCSGEGMFRKEPDLIKSWIEKGNDYYSVIQKQIITAGIKLLKDGGKLVYSTCTFSKKENEDVIEYALSLFPDLKVLPIKEVNGFKHGLTFNTKNAVRLYPHHINGEGHFVCLLQKGESNQDRVINNVIKESSEPLLQGIDFRNGNFINRNNKLFFEPNINTSHLRTLRSGLYLGEYKHDKFEPSHALALSLSIKEYNNILNLELSDPRLIKYLKCETLDVKDYDLEGLVLVCVNNYPLGWGQIKNGILKNKYPANYRYQ